MDGWVGGWVDGRESRVKDCLQQSKIKVKKPLNRCLLDTYFKSFVWVDIKFLLAVFKRIKVFRLLILLNW
jgi:hypothetical protein